MSRSAAEAAAGSSQIAANINSVAAVVDESTSAISNMDQTIAQVSAAATDLNSRVQVFRF
jgi:methyl-accepting chemotaxis protein